MMSRFVFLCAVLLGCLGHPAAPARAQENAPPAAVEADATGQTDPADPPAPADPPVVVQDQPVAGDGSSDEAAAALNAELKALREGLAAAFNSGDVDQLLSHCHPEVIATWQNGAVAVGHDGVRDVVRQLTSGESKVLASYSADPTVDHRLVLQEGTIVVAAGSLNDEYVVTRPAGAAVKLDSKWTVTAARLDGRWQVVSFHVSCDAFDNEVITVFMQMTRYIWGALGGGIGAVMGVALGLFLGRNRPGKSTSKSAGKSTSKSTSKSAGKS